MQSSSHQGRRRRRNLAAQARPAIAVLAAAAALVAAGVFTFTWLQPASAGFNLKDGQSEVRLDQPLVFSFNSAQDPGNTASSFHIDPAVDGALKLSRDRKQAVFTPAGRYQDLTHYTVSLHKQRWHFTTTLLPRVVQMAINGSDAALADGAQVPLTAAIKLAFNAEMDQASVTSPPTPRRPRRAGSTPRLRCSP